MDSHEKYLELCAASTAGELSREEQQELEKHLAVCASCRQAKRQYEITVQRAVPALADELEFACGGVGLVMVRRARRSCFFQATEE